MISVNPTRAREEAVTMGGYFSTRWNCEHTRNSTGGLLQLDVRRLARDGSLTPGAVSTVNWERNGEPAGTIVIAMDHDRHRLVLTYSTQAHGETEWTPHTVPVWLDSTPCHYGGERWWFRCPGCNHRRAVLYSVAGVFACTGCHDLAYASTRMQEWERGDLRIWEIARRLGYTGKDFPFRLPGGKPKGMHWTTYERLAVEFLDLHRDRNQYFAAQVGKILGR